MDYIGLAKIIIELIKTIIEATDKDKKLGIAPAAKLPVKVRKDLAKQASALAKMLSR
jgi:hypothetical protein